MKNLKLATITSHIQVTESVYLIKFKRNFEFLPGQILGVTISDKIEPRLYSICSSSNDKEIGILYQVKDDGALTPSLEKCKKGDNIWITEAQGKFLSKNEPAWWIATGTGIAPFYSMFKSGLKPLKLVQGARYKDNIYFNNEFNELTDYVICCSNDQGEGIYSGRLTQYIMNLETLPTNINYYICGSAEMVVDVRNLLINKGVEFNKIITEIYF